MRLVVHRATGETFGLGLSSWTEKYRLTPPWEAVEAVLAEPLRPELRPRARDVVTLQSAPGRVVFVGKVARAPWQINSTQAGEAISTSISLVGCFDVGRRVDVVASPAIRTRNSTLYPLLEWTDGVIPPLVAQVGRGEIGSAISAFVRALYQFKLPASLSKDGLRFGELAQVAWREEDGAAFGVGAIEPVQGFTINGIRSNLKTSSRAQEILLGTFGSAPLIELFPRLVDKPKGYSGQSIGGKVPVLVYRMAPWRDRPLRDLLRRDQVTAKPGVPGPTPLRLDYFDRVTWDPATAVTVTPSSISGDRDYEADYTAATGWFSEFRGGEDAKFVETLGLPIVDAERTDRDGASVFSLNWPFLPPRLDFSNRSIFELGQLLAATGMQFFANAAQFEAGRATLQTIDRRIAPGSIVKMRVGGSVLTAYVDEVTHEVRTAEQFAEVGETSLTFSRGTWPGQARSPSEINVRTIAPEAAPTPRAEASSIGCAAGRPTSWPSSLEAVRWRQPGLSNGLRRWALTRIRSSVNAVSRQFLSRDWDNGNLSDTEKRTILQLAAAYVIEKYWRQVHPEAWVSIEDLVRTGNDDAAHRFGGAIDFSVEILGMVNKATGERFSALEGLAGGQSLPAVPVFQSWGALRELARQGRIPPGGRGLYLNVTPTGPKNILGDGTGADPTDPRNAGSASGGGARPPGSAGETHYDHRGAFGFTRWNDIDRGPTSWLHLDTIGLGKDVIVQDSTRQSFPLDANGKLQRSGGTAWRVRSPGSDEQPAIYVPDGSSDEARRRHLSFEAARKALDPRAAAYIARDAAGDPWLPDVGPTVPNILQVIGHEPSCFIQEVASI